jgi:hypothetical protein
VLDGQERRTEERDRNLAAVRVAAEDQVAAEASQAEGGVRVVGERDPGGVLARLDHARGRVVADPEIAEAHEAKARLPPADLHALVHQHSRAAAAKRVGHPIEAVRIRVVPARVVHAGVVVSEDGQDAVRSREIADDSLHDVRALARARPLHVVAGQRHEVRPGGRGPGRRGAQVILGRAAPDVQVGQLGDGVAVEGGVEARDRDVHLHRPQPGRLDGDGVGGRASREETPAGEHGQEAASRDPHRATA